MLVRLAEVPPRPVARVASLVEGMCSYELPFEESSSWMYRYARASRTRSARLPPVTPAIEKRPFPPRPRTVVILDSPPVVHFLLSSGLDRVSRDETREFSRLVSAVPPPSVRADSRDAGAAAFSKPPPGPSALSRSARVLRVLVARIRSRGRKRASSAEVDAVGVEWGSPREVGSLGNVPARRGDAGPHPPGC